MIMTQPMKSPLTICFRNPGTEPPVYLAASFTDPPWHPNEMKHRFVSKVEEIECDDLEFYSTYQVPEGNHQYKFRLGNDDWRCDESSETVLDEAGNRNNLLRVEPRQSLEENLAAPSAHESEHIHGEAHASSDASNINRTWDLIGINPKELVDLPLFPQTHKEYCPLREHYNPDHSTYLANAAEACHCGKPSTDAILGKFEEKSSAPGSEQISGKAHKDGKQRPSAPQLQAFKAITSDLHKFEFVPVPESTPIFNGSEACSPDLKSGMRNNDVNESQSPSALPGSRASSPNPISGLQGNRSQSLETIPTSENVEEPSDTEDEPPQRRHLSDAEVESVRQSISHLSPRRNGDLVNSTSSDQPILCEGDRYCEAPRFPHEIPTSPKAYIPPLDLETPHDDPKLFPQAYLRQPTIDLLNDPILPAFRTGDSRCLERLEVPARNTERQDDHPIKKEEGPAEPMSEEQKEVKLQALVHSPTFEHEVPMEFLLDSRQSLHTLSTFIDGAFDSPTLEPSSKTPTADDILTRQERPKNLRYGSLHDSFADVQELESRGHESHGDDTTHLLRGNGSTNSLTETLRRRTASGVSSKTTESGGSSCCSWSEDSEHVAEEITFWRRIWHILIGWVASLWVGLTGKSVDDGRRESIYYDTVQNHD